jgi:hypothetical protein
VFELKHTHHFQYLLIHDPTEHDLTIPQIGEACKVRFVGTRANTASTARVNGANGQPAIQQPTDEACFAIYCTLWQAQAELDPGPAIEQHASMYLQRALTPEELSELLRLLSVDDADESYRLVAEFLV